MFDPSDGYTIIDYLVLLITVKHQCVSTAGGAALNYFISSFIYIQRLQINLKVPHMIDRIEREKKQSSKARNLFSFFGFFFFFPPNLSFSLRY